MTQGLKNTIKVKLIHVKCGSVIADYQYLPLYSGHIPLISDLKMAEGSRILAAQGLQNTIKVKLTKIQCGCHDHYIHFIPYFPGLILLISDPKMVGTSNIVNYRGSMSRKDDKGEKKHQLKMRS